MEYVDGETLAEVLRREGVLEPRRAAEVARWMCRALAAAHTRVLVYRDITPGNVLVSSAGLVKVMDFEVAMMAGAATLTGSGKLLGTAAYLSPEQAKGRAVDPRSDLYALGCVLYALLTGAPPFVGDSPVAVASRHVTEQPEPPSQRRARPLRADDWQLASNSVMPHPEQQPGQAETAAEGGVDRRRGHADQAAAAPLEGHGCGRQQGHLAQPARREVELGLPGLLRRLSPPSESTGGTGPTPSSRRPASPA